MLSTRYSCRLVMKRFPHRFSKNTQISNFIRPVGAELFHADEQTDGQIDTTKLIVAFRNFVNAPKNAVVLTKHAFPWQTC